MTALSCTADIRFPPARKDSGGDRAAHLARGGLALGTIALAGILFVVIVRTLQDAMISAVVVMTIMLTLIPILAATAEGRKRG